MDLFVDFSRKCDPMPRLNATTTLSRPIAPSLGLPISVRRIHSELVGIMRCLIPRSMTYTFGASDRRCGDFPGVVEFCSRSEPISCQSEKYAKKNGFQVDLPAAYGAGETTSLGTKA